MVLIDWTSEPGWHDPRVVPYGPFTHGPGDDGAALRAGDLRGSQGLRAAGRLGRHVPAGAERRPAEQLGRPARHAPSCRRSCSSSRCASWCASTATGCRPAARRRCTCGRSCSPPRSGSACGRPTATSTASSPRRPAPTSPAACKPVSVWWSTEYVRAAPGGTGAAKIGGNYAASLAAQAQAAEKGCDQVVWLDAVERRWVEEMGGMNLFFVFGSGVRPRRGRHPGADRLAAARRHPRFAAAAGPRLRLHRDRAADLHRRVGEEGRVR